MIDVSQREFLIDLFNRGVASCLPASCLPPHLPTLPPEGKTYVLGAGKAGAQMAQVVHATLGYPVEGLVVTRYGYDTKAPTGEIKIMLAGHPVPDANSEKAASHLLALAAGATRKDRILFMISGGGSALLMAPISGVKVEDKQAITRHLLRSGAPITDINFVRKHLSRIKGGGLAAAVREAECLTFIISDVVGDDAAAIASGPTIPMTRDPERAIAILRQHEWPITIDLAQAMRSANDIVAAHHKTKIIASGTDALKPIETELLRRGFTVDNLGAAIDGDASFAGRAHADRVRQSRGKARHAIISGGELTVEVKNRAGRGGPNLEYLTALMSAIPDEQRFAAIACDSDGIDGTEDNAGGYIDNTSLARAKVAGLSPEEFRTRNDTYPLFEALGDLIKTGPTGTNVNDIRIILMDPT